MTRSEHGNLIEFHFEKNRALLGDEVKPFEARLESKANKVGYTSTQMDLEISKRFDI